MSDVFKDLPIKKMYLDEKIRLLEYLNDRYNAVKSSGRAERVRALEILIDRVIEDGDDIY